jgi:hypothetical protein
LKTFDLYLLRISTLKIIKMKKSSLFIAVIAILGIVTKSQAQTPPSYVPTSGLKGWWSFSGNANDESGNGNDGTVNATLTSDRFGNGNKAYNFNGSGNVITLKTGTNVQGNNPRTISFWFKHVSSTQANYTIYQGGTNGDGNDFSVWFRINSNNTYQIHLRRFIDDIVTDSIPLVVDKWNHYCVVYDGTVNSGLKYYINGKEHTGRQLKGGGQTFNTASTTPQFGDLIDQSNNHHYLKGDLDDIGIWSRALTQQEITTMFNGSVGINQFSKINLISIYPNPTKSQITVTTETNLFGSVYKIYDQIGKIVLIGKINTEQTLIELNNLSGGLYLICIGDNLNQTFKILKI